MPLAQFDARLWRSGCPRYSAVLLLAAGGFGWLVMGPAAAQEAAGAISELRLSSAVPGELSVGWEPPSAAPVDYRVDWARSDEEFRSYTVDENHLYPAGTVSGVRSGGLLAGVEYQVRVRARYGGWSGPWSEARRTVSGEPVAAVRSQTPAAPGAPTVTAAAATATTLTVNWSAPGGRRLADQFVRAALYRERGL